MFSFAVRFNGSDLVLNLTQLLAYLKQESLSSNKKEKSKPSERPEDNEEEAEVATKHLFGFNGGSANKVHTYKPDQNVP